QNGEESKVLYVSKILSFKRLQQLLNIEHAQNMQEQEDLISPVEFNLESWWYRDLGEDKVLLYAPTEIVAKACRSGLQKTDLRLQRLNGQETVDSKLTNADHSQIYLVINAFNTERIFRERKERLVHTEMRGRELGQ